jgi:tetratricopeptide (TPR) repeat protein
MKKKNYDEVPAVLLPFVNLDEPPKFEIFFILGRAYQYRSELAQAIEIFEKAMNHHGLNTNCLNAIGECYFQLGDMSEALTAWMKSLEINVDQPKIKKNVEALKEKK